MLTSSDSLSLPGRLTRSYGTCRCLKAAPTGSERLKGTALRGGALGRSKPPSPTLFCPTIVRPNGHPKLRPHREARGGSGRCGLEALFATGSWMGTSPVCRSTRPRARVKLSAIAWRRWSPGPLPGHRAPSRSTWTERASSATRSTGVARPARSAATARNALHCATAAPTAPSMSGAVPVGWIRSRPE